MFHSLMLAKISILIQQNLNQKAYGLPLSAIVTIISAGEKRQSEIGLHSQAAEVCKETLN